MENENFSFSKKIWEWLKWGWETTIPPSVMIALTATTGVLASQVKNLLFLLAKNVSCHYMSFTSSAIGILIIAGTVYYLYFYTNGDDSVLIPESYD